MCQFYLWLVAARSRGMPNRVRVPRPVRAPDSRQRSIPRTDFPDQPPRHSVSAGAEPLPPGASIDDGLTTQEAVAIALWNSPSFQATLADLGVARADLAEAGLLRNPIFSLLFPSDPKQLEWTLQFPFDALWQRPRAWRRRN